MTSDVFFDNIQQQYSNKLPFVAYRKPNENTVKAVLQNDDELHYIADFAEQGFVFASFDDKEEALLLPIEKSRLISTEFVISRMVDKYHRVNDDHLEEERTLHIKLVEKGVETIASGQLQKVVLSRKENVELQDTNPMNIFSRLLNSYITAFVYCWYHPKVGLWLGATPETLLKVSGNRFTTMALAGTQQYKGNLDVQWSDKDKDEQQFVSDFIQNNLIDITEKLHLSEVKTVRAGSLLHLCTNISGLFNKDANQLKSILNVLHPTPAICGLPKNSAKQFILDNENYNREFYTGYLGELNLKTEHTPRSSKRNIEDRAYAISKLTSQLFVNLRCMQIIDSKAQIYIGGGITKDSIPEDEWKETVDKAYTMKNIL